MFELSRASRLPLKAVRGSLKERYALSDRLFDEFYNHLTSKIHSDKVSTETIKDAFVKTVPSKIGLQLNNINKTRNIPDNEYEGVTLNMIRGKNQKISGFQTLIPLINKDLEVKDINILLHEFKHIFDFITNPKFIQRRIFITKGLSDFYNEKVYNKQGVKLEKLEKTITNRIKKCPYYRRIDFLQYCRQELQTEIRAFNAEKSYNRLAALLPDQIIPAKKFDDIEYFKLNEKLAIVENLLKKELSKIREENKLLYG